MLTRTLAYALILFLITTNTYAQDLGSIKGNIIGNDDKLPILGAAIKLSPLNIGVASDSLG
jgi:hypothetical protein